MAVLVSGFTGTRCESQVTACDSDPCGVGDCIAIGLDDFECFCPVGFSGDQCEVVGAFISGDDNPCVGGFETCFAAEDDDFQCVCPGQVPIKLSTS